MIQDLSGPQCIKGTDESTLVMDLSVPMIHHDPDRSSITGRDPDHPRGTHPQKIAKIFQALLLVDQAFC